MQKIFQQKVIKLQYLILSIFFINNHGMEQNVSRVFVMINDNNALHDIESDQDNSTNDIESNQDNSTKDNSLMSESSPENLLITQCQCYHLTKQILNFKNSNSAFKPVISVSNLNFHHTFHQVLLVFSNIKSNYYDHLNSYETKHCIYVAKVRLFCQDINYQNRQWVKEIQTMYIQLETLYNGLIALKTSMENFIMDYFKHHHSNNNLEDTLGALGAPDKVLIKLEIITN